MVTPNRSQTEMVTDPELIGDFRGEYRDAVDAIHGILVDIERAADKHDGLHALFRGLHSIKSNLRMMQLNELSEFVHALESVLDDMRNDRVAYDSRFSDVTLLCLELIHDSFESAFAGQADYLEPLRAVQKALELMHEDSARFARHIQEVLLHLDPTLVAIVPHAADERPADLEFFRQMAAFIERRLGYAVQSMSRTLAMAEQINALAGSPIDVTQLRAAVYVHDVGMAFLPAQLLSKKEVLSDAERALLRKHPELSSDLLAHLGVWQEASRMVREHHERVDGQGYPQGLADAAICAGAKLLAVVDTYEAMTQTRAHREQKRTILRVVAEINAQSGKQFDPHWVNFFNQWIRQCYRSGKS